MSGRRHRSRLVLEHPLGKRRAVSSSFRFVLGPSHLAKLSGGKLNMCRLKTSCLTSVGLWLKSDDGVRGRMRNIWM